MGRNYRSMLPSGDSQMQGGNIGERQESPRQQEKPYNILQVINKKEACKVDLSGHSDGAVFFDQQEYERRVKVVVQGNLLSRSVRNAIGMLNDQLTRLNSIPLDAMRNNSHKLVNQDMDIAPLEEMNENATSILHEVATSIHNSKLMSRYNGELMKADHEKWQLSETDKAMMKGGDKACKYIEEKAEKHLMLMAAKMVWLPTVYHLMDKVGLVVLPIIAYQIGKHHLSNTLLFMWLIASMPVLILTMIWVICGIFDWIMKKVRK